MQNFSLLGILLLVSALAAGQSVTEGSDDGAPLTHLIPHPYIYVGPELMPNGYEHFACNVETGLDVESKHLIFRARAAYDNGRKQTDDCFPNPQGHDRHLEGAFYYRLSRGRARGVFLGAGFHWGELSTTNFTKHTGGPEIGGEYDLSSRHSCESCPGNFSMRLALDWQMGGSDWQNGSHGPALSLTLPSPRENRHWFFRQTVAVYRYYSTITEPGNVPLTIDQRSQQGFWPAWAVDYFIVSSLWAECPFLHEFLA